jgi:hypothetical protein
MPVSFNPNAGPSQAAAVSQVLQRGDDQVRNNARRDADKTETDTRPVAVSSARSQETETRNARQREEDRQSSNDAARDTRQGQSRGSVVDIRV